MVNRQTLAVTFGTLALVVAGAILLYASPTPKPAPAQHTRPVNPPNKGKQGAAAEAKPKRVPAAKLVHSQAIPADRAAAPEGAPNLVVVLTSAMRRDQLGLYGGDPRTTPFLSEMAAKGVLFDDALASAVWPKPAQVALLTGQYPADAGMVEPKTTKNLRKLADAETTLAERLSAAGWNTLGVTGSHYLNARFGMTQGFDWYRDAQPFSYMLDQRLRAGFLVEKTLEAVEARDEAAKARPLYLQLATIDSHKPFRVPPDEFKPFEGPDHNIAPYRATLRRTDDAIKELVTGLAAQGFTSENTVFVVVADHGEGLEMPAHHRKQHGRVLYQSSVSIPWLMWGKGVASGAHVAGLASQIDLVPTVVELLGLPAPEGLPGESLAKAVRGEAPRTSRELAYTDTFYEGVHRAAVWTSKMQCQQDFGSEEVVDSQFQAGCFDRAEDPEFTKPKENPKLMSKLEALHADRLKAADR